MLGTQRATGEISPAAALISNLQAGALDDPVDVHGQMFALEVHSQRLSGEEMWKQKNTMNRKHRRVESIEQVN